MFNRRIHSAYNYPRMGMPRHHTVHPLMMWDIGPHMHNRYYRRYTTPRFYHYPFFYGYRMPYYRRYGFGGGLGIILALLFLSYFLVF